MSDTSIHDSIREIRDALGLPWELRANTTLVKYNIEPHTKISVLTEFLVTTETNREVRFTRRGKRLAVWEARWDFTEPREPGELFMWKYSEVVMWDDTFEPYTEHKIGRIETPEEYRARRIWEGEQYRVGSAKSPMDSAYRVTLGHTTDAMTNYWNK